MRRHRARSTRVSFISFLPSALLHWRRTGFALHAARALQTSYRAPSIGVQRDDRYSDDMHLSPPVPSIRRYRNDIEGLRGIAVLLVVAFHVGVPSLPGGFVGVDVFFVLSGYLITGLLVTEHARTGQIAPAAFYARRVRRLLPASAVMVVGTLAIAAVLYTPLQLVEIGRTALATAGYVSNWHFIAQASDYFGDDVQRNPLLHTWSLAVEEQFYLVWPWLVLLALGRAHRTTRLRTVLLGVLVASALACVWWTRTARPLAFYGTPARAWEFAVGGLLATLDGLWGRLGAPEGAPEGVTDVASGAAIPSMTSAMTSVMTATMTAAGMTGTALARDVAVTGGAVVTGDPYAGDARVTDGAPVTGGAPWLRWARWTCGWVGLALVVGAAMQYTETVAFPGWRAWIPVLGTAGLLVGGRAVGAWSSGRLLGASSLQTMGRVSYAWYLWHWPVLLLGSLVWPAAGIPGRLALATLAFGVAWASTRWVEAPVRTAPWLLRAPSVRTLQVGVVLTGTLAIATLGYQAGATWLTDQPQYTRFAKAAHDLPPFYADHCDVQIDETVVRVCGYGDPAGAATVALIGDSHAAAWSPAFDAVARATHVRLLVISKAACPLADISAYSWLAHRPFTECEVWRLALWDTLQRLHPATIVLANFTNMYTREPDDTTNPRRVPPAAWGAGLERTLRRLTTHGARVVVMADVPKFTFNVPICLVHAGGAPWWGQRASTCVESDAEVFNPSIEAVSTRAVAAVPGTARVSLASAFCVAHRCAGMVDGVVAYRDNNHLTATMSRHVAPALGTALAATHLWPGTFVAPQPH